MTKEEHNHECNCKRGNDCCKNSESGNIDESVESNLAESQLPEKEMHEKKACHGEELKKQYDDMKGTLQRVYAEFQNYKKRTEDNRQKSVELSNEELIKRILPIMDNLELALSNKKQDDEFSRGIELIYAQFTQMLEDEGVKRILSSGKYDPKLHEVLMTEESSKEEGVILEELQKGYTLGSKILRHAKVKIAKHAKK